MSEASNPWKILKILKPTALSKTKGSRYGNRRYKADLVEDLADKYESVLSDPTLYTTMPNIDSSSFVHISEREVIAAITQATKNACPGDDGVTYRDLSTLYRARAP